MRFKHLNVPDTWQHYWSKYPEGYTILEALISWVSQVDSMVDNVNDWNTYLDNFVETFDDNLQTTVHTILSDWEKSGLLADIINKATNERIDVVEDNISSINQNIDYLESSKIDKNGSGQVTWANMSQDARLNISGDKTAVVGVDSVGTDNIVNNSVTLPKISETTQARILSNGLDRKLRQEVLFDNYSNNLFNRKTVTNGLLQYIDGVESVNTSSSSFFHSDYIKVEPNTRYWVAILYSALTSHGGNEYDSNFKLLKKITPDIVGPSTAGSFVTGSQTKYIRINGPYSLLNNYYVIKTETQPQKIDAVERYGYGYINGLKVKGSQISSEINPNFLPTTKPINLFDKRKAIVGGLVSGEVSDNQNLLASDFLRVTEGQKLYFNYAYSTAGYVYNDDLNFIDVYGSGYSNIVDENNGWWSYVIPKGGKYVRYQLATSVVDNFMLVNTEEKPSQYIPYGVGYNITNQSNTSALPLQNKRVLLIGDSITWLDGTTDPNRNNGETVIGWQQSLRDLGATIINKAQSGHTYRKYVEGVSNLEHGSLYDDIVEGVYNPTDIDMVLMVAGTNDVGRGLQLGTVGGTDPNNTLDAMCMIIEYLFSKNKELELYIVTPPFRQNSQSDMALLVPKLKDVALYYNLPFYDNYHEGNINNLNITTYLYDSVHPNNKGMALIGSKISKFVTSK